MQAHSIPPIQQLRQWHNQALASAERYERLGLTLAAKTANATAQAVSRQLALAEAQAPQPCCEQCGQEADELYNGICEECLPPLYDCATCQDQGVVEVQLDADDFVERPCPHCGWEDDPYDYLLDQRARAYPW